MTARRPSEAERLRQCRRVFERAVRDGTSMDAAREALARDDWRASDARLAEKRAAALCGTEAPRFVDDDEAEAHLPWWVRL